ncbi:hypothetical protein CLV51_10967 [Chitinophaga niastensis]|uniref:Uncharacterized protein n=1 Tax=Chitinophaga niastensis TaxID=536980 RepID=A0A2P8HA15_CHINA|nr:hypothetical protein [Chitinophaga niastensis]PSL43073.1 hypothetical protein CLV51_10967 [Chitinophaga niastensis]
MKSTSMKLKQLFSLLILIMAGMMVTVTVKAQVRFGDNLGNHKATDTLRMQNNFIVNAKGVAIGTAVMANNNVALQVDGSNSSILIPRITDTTAITTPLNGMIVYNSNNNKFYVRQNGVWVTFASSSTGAAVTSLLAAAGGSAPNSNGFSLSPVSGTGDVTITLQPADAINPGLITTAAQTFGGNKTFNGNTIFTGTLTANGASSFNGNTSVTGTNTFTVGTGASTLGGSLTLSNTGIGNSGGITATDSLLLMDVSSGVVKKTNVAAITTAAGAITTVGTTAVTTSGQDGKAITATVTGNTLQLNMQGANATNAGVVTAGTQAFSGVKTFNNNVIANDSLQINNPIASTATTDLVLVRDANGVVKTASFSAGFVAKDTVAIPAGTDANLNTSGSSTNFATTVTLAVPGATTDDGITVNFLNADLASFNTASTAIAILSAVATGTNTVKVTLANFASGTTTAIDGKRLVVTYIHR